MTTPARFANGLTNVGPTNPMHALGMLDPTKFIVYWNDFHNYTAGDWTVTETTAGATQATTAGNGGLIALVTEANDDDVNQLQLNQETFKIIAGKKSWFKARFKVSDVTQTDVYFGLIITDTSVAGGVTDGLYFRKADGAATMIHVLEKDSAESSSGTVATLVNDTFVTAAFYYNGKDAVEVFIDDVKQFTHTTLTNLCDDEELAVTITLQNGEAGAKTLTTDYVLAVSER
jgi:hypothetical protein